MGSSIVTARPRIILDPLPVQPQAMAPIPQGGTPHVVLDPLPPPTAALPQHTPVTSTWEDTTRQLLPGVVDIGASLGGAVEAIGQKFEGLGPTAAAVTNAIAPFAPLLPTVGRAGTSVKEKAQFIGRMLPKPPSPESVVTGETSPQKFLLPSMARSAPSMGGTIIAGALGGTAGAGVFNYLLNAGGIYNDLRSKGVPADKAANIAGIVGIPIAYLDTLFVKGLLKPGVIDPFLKRVATGTVKEAVTEGGQEVLAGAAEWVAGVPDSLKNLAWRVAGAMGVGGAMGGTVSTVAPRARPETPPPPPPTEAVTSTVSYEPAPPAAPAPVVPRMAGTNAPAFQATAPPPTGPYASRVPTPTAPRAGPPLTAVPKLEGTNAPQFQGAPPTPTGPFASRVPTPTQPPIQGPAPRPPYEPVPAEGVVQKDIRTPVPFPARESAEAFGLMGPRQTPPAGPMSPAEQSAQVLMRANQGARRATVTPQESRLGDPAAELLGEAREEVSRLLSTPRDPVHPNDPIVHEHLWEWLGSEDPRAVVIREQLIEVWPRRSAPGPDPVPSRTDLLVWAKEVEKSQQQPAPPPVPPAPAVETQAPPPQPLIPPAPQQTPPPPALSLGPQRLSPAPQPGAAPTATAAAIAPPPAVAPFTQQVTYPPQRPAPPTPTDADKLAAKVLTGIGETPPAPAVVLPSEDEVAAAKARNAAQKAKNAALRGPASLLPQQDLTADELQAEYKLKTATFRFPKTPAQSNTVYTNQGGTFIIETLSGGNSLQGKLLPLSDIVILENALKENLNIPWLGKATRENLQKLHEQVKKWRESAPPDASLGFVRAQKYFSDDIRMTAREELLHGMQFQVPLTDETMADLMQTPLFAKAGGAVTEMGYETEEDPSHAFREVTAKVLSGDQLNLTPAEQEEVAKAYADALVATHGEGVLVLFKYIKPGPVREAFYGRQAQQESARRAAGVVEGGGGQLQPGATGGGEGPPQGGRPGPGVQAGAAGGVEQAGPASFLERRVAAGEEAAAKRRAQEQSGKLRSPNPIELAQWIRDMVTEIIGDVASGAIKIGNAVQVIVDKFGEEARPHAMKVFLQAKAIADGKQAPPPGMAPAGAQTAPGASAAASASVTATQPTGSPQGQPPPLPTEPRDMPSLRTEGLSTAQRVNIGIRTVGTINRNNLQFRQMAEQNPDFQPIQDQLAAKNRMDRTIQDWKNKGGDAMEEWNALGEERGRQLSDFNYTVQDWTQRANRPLTEQEVMQLADKAGLDEETVAVYQRQQQTFREFWEGLRQAEVSELEREIKDPEALASAIATLNKEVDEKARRNYFPLMRFGDWMVTSYLKTDDPKYPSGKKVHRHEQYASEKAAEEAATRMERDYAAAGIVPENVTVGELSPEVRDMGHLPPSIAERLASKLNLTDKQRAAFDDMMASTMVERSGRQHQKYREGIPGYSRDGKRTAGAYFSAMSNLIGRTAERGNILQAVNDARTYRKNLRAETPGQFVNLTKINHMIEFMDDAAKNQISPKVHSNTLSGAMMLWWLGYNPKQILLNFTQLGQGVAVLADQVGPDGGKVGIPAATAQMLKAIRDVSHAYSKRVFSKDKHKVVGAPGDQQNYIGNLTREEWEALENARLSGLVGETNAKMVTQHAKTSTLEKLGGRISGISGEEAGRKRDEQLAHLAEGSMAGFQWSEEWLRRTILVASGRAMKAKGSANPWGTAEQVVRSSQGSHEASNRSKLQRDWPKTLIFKSFLLNNAYLGTLSPYRRKIWLAQLLLAGLTGGFAMEHFFQLIDTLGSLFNWHFFGMKNPRVDLQHAIREWVNWGAGKASVPGAGPYASEFLLKGLAGGIPGNPWDLQASTSQGKALPFIEQFLDLINGTTTPQNALWKTAEDITGLGGSTMMNATKALVEDSPTSENIIRTVMPKAVSQPIQAARALAAGGVRDSKGAKLITLDPSKPRDVIEIIGMAGGIQPKRLTQAREQKWAPKELNLYYDNLLRGLQNDYNKARATKDPQVIRAMNKEIIRINREVLPQGFNRTLGEYLANYQNRNKGLRKEERGVPPGAVRRRGYVKGYMGAYGDRAQ
jgi:hypothetical protein